MSLVYIWVRSYMHIYIYVYSFDEEPARGTFARATSVSTIRYEITIAAQNCINWFVALEVREEVELLSFTEARSVHTWRYTYIKIKSLILLAS